MPTGPLDRWDVVAKPGRARIRVARGRAGTKTLLRMPQIPVRCISDRRPTALQMTVACSRPKFRRLRPWWSPVRLAAICISHVLTLAASQNCCRALTRQLRQGFGLIHERGAAQAKMEDSWPVESDQRIEVLDFPALCSSGPSSVRSVFGGTPDFSPSADVDRFQRYGVYTQR